MDMEDKSQVKPNLETRSVQDLKNWKDNPRKINEIDFDRLEGQIKRLGVYKPLLVNQDNIVLGGNMRLIALKNLGIEEVAVSVVHTKDTSEMLEYALSDNDSAGHTDELKVAELATLHPMPMPDLYAVQLKPLVSVQKVIDEAGPGGTPVSFRTKIRSCPKCGFEGETSEFPKVRD